MLLYSTERVQQIIMSEDREQEEQRIIGENIQKLVGLDEEAYPALATVFRKAPTFRAHICQIWEYMQQHPTPVGRDSNGSGNGYWFVPVSYLMQQHRGAANTWQSHIALADHFGLLWRVKPDEKSNFYLFREEYERAKQKQQRPRAAYRIVEYTPERLEAANQRAAEHIRNKGRLSSWRKSDFISMYGQQAADRLYHDGRKIPEREAAARQAFIEVVKDQVDRNGYTTPEAARQQALQHLPAGAERWAALEKVMQSKTALLLAAGFQYRPPKREQREKFGLTGQNWIIIRAQ